MSHMTDAQIITLRAGCFAIPAAAALIAAGNSAGLQSWLNSADAGVVCWKTSVPLADVAANVDGVELVGLTAIKLAAYQALLLAGTVNPSKDRTRAGFDAVFSAAGGATTRPLLLALWKRAMTRAEKIFATGTGTDASPAYVTWEGDIDATDSTRVIFKDNGTIWTPQG